MKVCNLYLFIREHSVPCIISVACLISCSASTTEPSQTTNHFCTFLQLFHRLHISLVASHPANIPKPPAAALHLLSGFFKIDELRQSERGTNCDTFVWLHRFFSTNTSHVTGVSLLWRGSPYWESLCQSLSDGTHTANCFFFLPSTCNTQLGFFSSSVSLERRWCVCEQERWMEKKDESVRVKETVHGPDGFEQTPSKAKDEMSHVGATLPGGIRHAWFGHVVSANTWEKGV